MYNLLEAERTQLTTERDQKSADLERVTIELDSVHRALGEIAPEEVYALAEERNSLSAQVARLEDEISGLRGARLARPAGR